MANSASGEFGEFWARKMRNFHNRFDANRDGKLSEEDYTIIADRINASAGLTGKAAEETKRYFTDDVWKVYFKSANGNTSTPDELIANLKKAGKKAIIAEAYKIMGLFFKAIDTNRSGLISLQEFTKFFEVVGMSEELAKEAFVALDINGDGSLSRGEFIQAGSEYFVEENQGSTSDLLFGPVP